MIGEVWTEHDIEIHLISCAEKVEVSTFGYPQRFFCNCGEVARHTPLAIAYAELERDCPPW